MADFNIAINLKANDLGSAQVIAGMRGNLKGLGADLSGNFGAGGKGSRALQQFGTGLTTAGTAVSQLTNASRGVLDPIIKEGVTFERSMSEVLAFGGSKFAPFMEQLHNQARQLGRDTEFTAVQAASSMRQLAQAGLDPGEIMGTLPTVMDLAKAGALDLAPAAKIVASTMAQFSVETKDAADVADILAKTANSTQTNVTEIGKALQFAGTSADLLGLNVEQTAVILAAMGKTAVTSGKAGRQLDSVFLGLSRLTNPDLRKGLRQIGVDQKKLTDNLAKQDIGAILGQFKEGFDAKGLGGVENAARRMEIITKIFGKIGARGFLALSKTAESGKFTELAEDIHNFSGAAAEMGGIVSDTTQGDLKRADSALNDLKLTIAKELLPALRPLLKDVTELVKQFAAWAKENPETVREMAVLAVKVTALGTVLGPLLTSAGSLVTVISAMGMVSGITSAGGLTSMYKAVNKLSPSVSGLVGSTAGKAGMFGAVVAAGALGVAFGSWLDETFGISDAMAGLNTEMSMHNRLLAEGISLQVGLSRIRGAAKLGSLSKEDQDALKAAQANKERLSAELAEFEDSLQLFGDDDQFFGIGDGRGSSQIGADIQKQQAVIDRINERGLEKERRAQEAALEATKAVTTPAGPAQADNSQALIDAINKSHFGTNGGATVKVIVDQDNRLIGVEGLDNTGAGTGDITEGI